MFPDGPDNEWIAEAWIAANDPEESLGGDDPVWSRWSDYEWLRAELRLGGGL